MKRNEAGQELHVIAFNADGRVTGNAAQLSCTLAIDGGNRNAITNGFNEIGNTGEYVAILTQPETNGHALSFVPQSNTNGVQVLAVPSNLIYTTREQSVIDELAEVIKSGEAVDWEDDDESYRVTATRVQ